jgi:hypothetical protein
MMKLLRSLAPVLTIFMLLMITIGYQPAYAVTNTGTTVPDRSTGCAGNSDSVISIRDLGIPTYGCGSDRSIIETIMKLVFGAMAMFSLLFLVIGGLRYTLSGGDSNAIATAKKTMTYALLGLVLGVSVFTIVSFIFERIA